MKKFLFIILIFVSLILIACSSSHSSTDSDVIPDTDTDSQDSEVVDDDSDSQNSEIIDDSYETPDQDGDADSSTVNCIYIYPGQEDSKLCFGPVKTNVKCKANPKENKYVTVLESDNSLGNVDEPMDINDDFVFFVLNPKDSKICFDGETYCPNIYGCNRKDEYVYEIVLSKFIHNFFATDKEWIAFKVWDGTRSSSDKSHHKIMIGNLETKEIFDFTDWGSFGKMQMKYIVVNKNWTEVEV